MTSAEDTMASVRRLYELVYTPGTDRFAEATDARISPDGGRIAFTGTLSDDLDSGVHTRIGSVEDGQVRTLTHGPNDDRGPRWSPDGRQIGFISDRDRAGRPQLLLLDPSSGDVRTTASVDGVVEYLEWAPDGRSILLGVAGWDADQGDVPGPGRPPVVADGVSTHDPDWTPVIRDQVGQDRSRGIWLYDPEQDAVRRLTPTRLNVWEAAWCGTSVIVAVTSQGSTEGAWFDSELRSITIADGSHRLLYRGTQQIGKPACSASGRRVAVISGLCSDRGVVPGEAILVDVEGGDHRVLDTAGTDVTGLTWLDDDRLAFIGIRHLDTVAGIARSSAPDARASVTWVAAASCGRHIPHATFAPSGAMAVVRESYSDYQQIFVVEGGIERVELSLAPEGIYELLSSSGHVEPVTWQAPDGETIEGWLCKPSGDGPFPMVLHVHGGPVGATTNAWNMGNDTTRLLVRNGIAVLHPNPRGSYGRGQTFVRKVLGDMGGADAEDLMAGVDAMVARGTADPARLAVVGTSYGGFMAALLPTRTDRFAAAVAMSPVTDWESFAFTSNIPEFARLFLAGAIDGDPGEARRSRSPLSHASRCRTPTLEVAGLRDLCTPFEQAARFHDVLSAVKTPSRLVGYPTAGHGVQHLPALIDLCARIIEWLGDHLGAPVPQEHGPRTVDVREPTATVGT